ncbi:early nodulin-like protein 18 [Rhododendron vialii]|uniref:early nodulin-like protein 18 n=1 Tax=Rhododendron vialii TaxID=182163 RepID=UPI00265F968C|nr:early nodulin-like protein 18 [Rhododendron vialii]
MAATMAYLTLIALSIAAAAATPAAATTYTNYTVGGAAGWLFNESTTTCSANYSSWAANQTFDLGDYLIFYTNSNVTVIQTYNLTTYQSCSTDNALDTDTFQYGGGDENFGVAETISVPLTIEGPNYFFSDADDGVQCKQGMAFEIVVNYGLGLPPSLNQPPPPPYTAPPTPPSSDDSSPTIAVQPIGGGFRACANLHWVVIIALLGGGFILV